MNQVWSRTSTLTLTSHFSYRKPKKNFHVIRILDDKFIPKLIINC